MSVVNNQQVKPQETGKKIAVPLLEDISEAKTTIDLFLDNKFQEAKARLNECGHAGMYGQLAHSTILFVQATATIEHEHLLAATEHIRTTLNVCNANRRKAALTEALTKQIGKRRIAIFKDYTEEQAHAELCYAEGLLQLAFLSMLQDEKLTTLIRSSLKIRQCYKCYRICWRILKHREWNDGLCKSTFESGVRLGVGAFNMMISLLPKRVLKLLEFVGFSGDRQFGLQQLRIGAGMRESLRAPLCALLLLVHDLYATHMLGDTVSSVSFEQPEHVVEAKELLSYWKIIYPKSAIFMLLAGRSEAVAGDLEKAIETFERATELPVDWPQYRHICYWELMWCYALRADWMKAVQCAETLVCESQWSQASYRYMKAAFLLQWLDDPGVGTPKPSETKFPNTDFSQYETREKTIEHIDKLLIEIPKLMQRFAGRSLPLEKIALRKSKRYFAQNKRLTLPALELIFIWNGFKMVQFQQDSVMSFLMICENKINELLQLKEKYDAYYDDYCLALLLKGVCLRCRGQQFQASMCYQEILQSKKKLKMDTYLLPFCEMELCQLVFDEGDVQQASKHLERALGYKGYSLESRLHFRIHEMETKLSIRGRKKSMSKEIKKSGSEVQIPFHPMSDSSSCKSVDEIAQAQGDSGSDIESANLKPIFPEFDDDDFDDMDNGFSSEESAEP
ncbi:Tetratricopeptide repeat protein 39B [Fasciola gigantica]|uniref:Tetratricopeptide repeat protein 39B n=1 Tax=Fasciola gigantica TaxID=46835 RepID=A0A504Z3T9_FASGI|nr:Tetratricopeptide repeat protein 39B [Fasciola gigantica]